MITVARCLAPEFNESKHLYSVNGKRVPGVSEILKAIGITKDFSGVDPFYRERGIATHKAIEYYLHDVLDEATVDAVCLPYLQGFKDWWARQDTKFAPATEVRLYSNLYGYAGTIDLVLDNVIVDYKCSKSPDPAGQLQGILYQQLVRENYGAEIPFKILQLPGDGNWSEMLFKDDPSLLNAVIRLYQWKINHV